MNSSISFRYYQRTDLLIYASITAEAFPLKTRRFIREESSKFMQAYIDSRHATFTYYEHAIKDGEVAGLIFGQIKRKSLLVDMSQTLKRLFLISVRFLLGRYGSLNKLIKFLNPCFQELRVFVKKMPTSEEAIELFSVAPKISGDYNRAVSYGPFYQLCPKIQG